MTVHFAMPADTASLTDKELEVLRLLAAGHTVKSIAVHLGKSEASINERLRDARRKTGMGSSRELARLLDSQKIWDKNIDLSDPRSFDQSQGQPPMGPQWSKGTITMLLALPIAAAALMIGVNDPAQPVPANSASNVTAGKPSPLVGRWSLDVSRIPAPERPRAVTISFSLADGGKWTTMVEIAGADGTTRRLASTAMPDGVAVPVTGNTDFIDSASLRQPAPNTLVMTLAKGGRPVSTRVYAVSKDRKAMTETIVWAGAAMPKLETTYFNRID